MPASFDLWPLLPTSVHNLLSPLTSPYCLSLSHLCPPLSTPFYLFIPLRLYFILSNSLYPLSLPPLRAIFLQDAGDIPALHGLSLTPTSMLGGLLFSVMDTTIVSTALVTIATDLQNFQDMYWVVLAYMLSYLGEQPSSPPLLRLTLNPYLATATVTPPKQLPLNLTVASKQTNIRLT